MLHAVLVIDEYANKWHFLAKFRGQT